MSQILEFALNYASSGMPVFPCNLEKQPLTKRGFKDATTDPSQIEKWWKDHPDASIGMPTGGISGMWVLDYDGYKEGASETLGKIYQECGFFPDTKTAKSPNGGKHYYFKSNGFKVQSTNGKYGPGVDIKGDGGYIILPPSKYEKGEKKGEYQWTRDINAAEAPEKLISYLVQDKKAVDIRSDIAGYSEQSANEVLHREIKNVRNSKQGERNTTLNKSAFILGQLVGSGELDQDEVEDGLTESALECGLDEGEVERTIRSGLEKGMENHKMNWPLPISLDQNEAPTISLEGLPDPLCEFCEAVSDALQVPVEIVLANTLAVIATAVQRKFVVQVTETEDGYKEPLNIFITCALNPAERKSAAVEVCKEPLNQWEDKKRKEIWPEMQERESERKSMEKIIERKRNELAKAEPEEYGSLMEEIKSLEKKLPGPVTIPRLLGDDLTPEALAEVMSIHEQKISVIEAEGGIFETLAGRYSRSVPNLDAVLKSWSGEAVKVDRKGKEPISLHNQALTLCISPQPAVIRDLSAQRTFRSRGLIGRFLFLMPQGMLGRRRPEAKSTPSPVRKRYGDIINSLMDIPWNKDDDGESTPYKLRLTPEALTARNNYAGQVEKKLAPGGEFEFMTDWGGKLVGNSTRLAGLIHCAKYYHRPHQYEIEESTMKTAISMADALADHAKVAFQLMGRDKRMECAQAINDWLIRERISFFTARDALEKIKGKFPTMAEVNDGLLMMEERYHISKVDIRRSGPGRRSSQRYQVNPHNL